MGFTPSPTRKCRAETQRRTVADTAHVSCFVTSHLFDRGQGHSYAPEKHPLQVSPELGVLLLFSKQKGV